MTRGSALPERLHYLQPFRKKFASRSEELNEDTGVSPLLALFRKRIAGKSSDEAEQLLEQDIAALKGWLAEPEHTDDCLQFATGFFLIASPSELIRLIREETEKQKEPLPCVEMDVWPGIKPCRFEKERDGGMLVKWKGLMFAIAVMSEETAAKGQKSASLDFRNQVTSSPVQFGEVTGTKYVEMGENRFGRPSKRIVYRLAVPGGHVEISLDFIGRRPSAKWDDAKIKKYVEKDCANWDETPVESLFHTLRIVIKKPVES